MNNTSLHWKLYEKYYKKPFNEHQQKSFFPSSLDDSPYGIMIFQQKVENILKFVIQELSILQNTSINDTTRGILVRNYIQNRLDLAKRWIPEEITDETEILKLNKLIQEYNLNTIPRISDTNIQWHAKEILITLDPTLKWTLY